VLEPHGDVAPVHRKSGRNTPGRHRATAPTPDATAPGLRVMTSFAGPAPATQPILSAKSLEKDQSHRAGDGGAQELSSMRPLEGLLASRWALPAVLVIQALMSIRLMWANTAFQDEAAWLWAGHLEIDHVLHHVPIVAYAAWFSGSPVIYPLVGAIANNVGGLAAARLLSLIFMLVSTTLLHGVTRRMFDSRAAAWFAAALFAGLGSIQFLGGFAMHDGLAIMLLALSVWIGVRAAWCGGPARAGLIVLGAVVLALADVTNYSEAIFDPVAIAVVALAVWRVRGKAIALATGAAFGICAALLLAGAYHLGGQPYAQGIRFGLHLQGGVSALPILQASAKWECITAVLAVVGAILVTRRREGAVTAVLAWVLAAAAFVSPAEHVKIHSLLSLFKQIGIGAWFGSAVGGYALFLLSRAARPARAALALRVSVAAAVLAAAFGFYVASVQYHAWPNFSKTTAALDKLLTPGGNYLAEDDDVPGYYLENTVRYSQWTNTYYIGYLDPKTGKYLFGLPGYADAIRRRYFTAILLNFGDTAVTDQAIVADMNKYGTYRLAETIPYMTSTGRGAYQIWTPRPPGKPHKPGRPR
jgi:hypothetical protein